MSESKEISILGAGQVAAYAANEIRKYNKKIKISIFSEENYLPYERPPLSKDSLTGRKKYDELSFFPNDFYIKENIQIKNKTVEEVNLEKKTLITKDSQNHTYDTLLIATGSKNKMLNFGEDNDQINNNILYLRNIEDSKKIKQAINTHNNFAIVGGGFIGLEIASSIAQLGKVANIIEISSQLMGRVIPQQIASLVSDYHERNGNVIFLNSNILSIKKKNKGYLINLNNNKQINVDFIIAGIGSTANDDLFKNTTLKLDNGIITDEFCRTSEKDVFAAGDVANFFHPLYNSHIRLESYQHAQNHGISAAKNMLGYNTPYTQIPWMWSDQFNLNLQLVGLCNDYDQEIQRGESIEEGIIYFFLKNKKIMGACGIGKAGKVGKDIRIAGKISENNVMMEIKNLKNKDIKLNKFLKK